MMRILILAALLVGEVQATEMAVLFSESNTLASIRIGAAEFATGGGDLWTAQFASATNMADVVSVAAHEAAAVSRRESGDMVKLMWRDVPLGGERGVLDATATVKTRSDGSQV